MIRSGRRPSARQIETSVLRQWTALEPTHVIITLAITAWLTVAAAISLPATARADEDPFNARRFQSPSGDIVCVMQRNHDRNDPAEYGNGEATCQVQNVTYPLPPREYVGPDGRPSTCFLSGWGSQFSLHEGRPPHLDCVGGALVYPNPPLPTLEYGQTMSLGAITCASEPGAMTCTDTSSGNLFRVSPTSYQLG